MSSATTQTGVSQPLMERAACFVHVTGGPLVPAYRANPDVNLIKANGES